MGKAQASVEYILIVSFTLLIIIPMLYLFYNFSKQSSDEVVSSQLLTIGYDITNAAEKVYYMGEPSRIVLEENFPEGMELIYINAPAGGEYSELVFRMKDGSETAMFSEVRIGNTIKNFNDEECSDVEGTCWSQGAKNIKVQAEENQVNIYIG